MTPAVVVATVKSRNRADAKFIVEDDAVLVSFVGSAILAPVALTTGPCTINAPLAPVAVVAAFTLKFQLFPVTVSAAEVIVARVTTTPEPQPDTEHRSVLKSTFVATAVAIPDAWMSYIEPRVLRYPAGRDTSIMNWSAVELALTVTGVIFVRADETPAGPLAPVAPVAPDGPEGPAGPLGPDTPLGPEGPLGPLAPDGPEGPVAPVAPAGPLGPVAPVAPPPPPPACSVHVFVAVQA